MYYYDTGVTLGRNKKFYKKKDKLTIFISVQQDCIRMKKYMRLRICLKKLKYMYTIKSKLSFTLSISRRIHSQFEMTDNSAKEYG